MRPAVAVLLTLLVELTLMILIGKGLFSQQGNIILFFIMIAISLLIGFVLKRRNVSYWSLFFWNALLIPILFFEVLRFF